MPRPPGPPTPRSIRDSGIRLIVRGFVRLMQVVQRPTDVAVQKVVNERVNRDGFVVTLDDLHAYAGIGGSFLVHDSR